MGKGWKRFMKVLGVLTIGSGAVLVLGAFGFNLLSFAGSWSNWVAGILGAGTVWFGFKQFSK